jgi:hypothetical protein
MYQNCYAVPLCTNLLHNGRTLRRTLHPRNRTACLKDSFSHINSESEHTEVPNPKLNKHENMALRPPPPNMWINSTLGSAMAQAVSRRPLTAEARFRSRVSPCEICFGQSGTGTGFSPSCRFSPVNFIPLVLH